MITHDDAVRCRHMLEAARKARQFIRKRTRADLDTDEQLALSIVRLLEIIGEAGRAVSPACRQRHPAIPWQSIAGVRDRLIHGYYDVDLDIVWRILTADLPPLIKQLEHVLDA